MKTIYFVRHGQTLMNIRHVHQGPDEPLTDLGKTQALEVAKRLKEKNIDTLVTSPYVRARETAAIIGEELDLPYTTFDGVVEFRRPDSLYGHGHYTLSSLKYLWQLFSHRTNPNWDNEGAENMLAIRNRIVDTKHFLEKLEGERIAVVTHAIYTSMFAQAVCSNRPLTFRQFVSAFLAARTFGNTNIRTFAVEETTIPGTCAWSELSLLRKEQ